MHLLYLSDLMKNAGLDPKRVKLIRHAYSDEKFRACANAGKIYEYTCHQKKGFSKGYDYWCVFVSGKGTLAKFYALYRVGAAIPDCPGHMPEGMPEIEAKEYKGENEIYNLEYIDILKDYENRLTIDWGNGTRRFAHKGTTMKPIVSLHSDEKVKFVEYDQVLLSYDMLKEIVSDEDMYDDWHTALKSVYAIYLIVDTKTGQQYVGSAYGEGGLLGRWSCYVATQHGNNKLMKEIMCQHPDRYHDFQFSILQILPKTLTSDEVTTIEARWKKKLLSIQYGMNDN